MPTDEEGTAHQQIAASKCADNIGLSYTLTDGQNHAIEGGYVFTVDRRTGFDGREFRFNDHRS